MSSTPLPWRNVEIMYCARCRIAYSRDRTRCVKCGADLVVQVRRQKLEEE